MKAAAPTLVVQDILVSLIQPSLTNPRKHIDQKQLEELAQSIGAVGIQVPLSLRLQPNGTTDHFEIIGGERRWRAAQIAGVLRVPAIVRVMDDQECREAQLIENLQREDLGPLEEADAYENLLARAGSVQGLALRVGKSLDYVTRRLKLRSLIDYSRQAMMERLITLDHALLLAKLGAGEQESAVRFTINRYCTRKDKTSDLIAKAIASRAEDGLEPGLHGGRYWEPQSPLELKHHIESSIKLQLSRASWDLADAGLVESAGPCTTCPSNTAANSALFGDLAIEEATCTDAACFNAKKAAYVQIQTAAISTAGAQAVRFSWKPSTAAPRMDKHTETPKLDQVFRAGQWVEAKKGACPNVVQGVSVDDDVNEWHPEKSKRMGAQLLVCVAGGCKVHRKEWEKPAAKRNGGPVNYNAETEKLKRQAQERAAEAENKIRLELAKRAVAGVKVIPPLALRILALRAMGYGNDLLNTLEREAKKTVKSAAPNSAEFAKAVAAIVLSLSGGSVGSWQPLDYGRPIFLEALALFGVDGRPAWKAKAAQPAKAAKKTAPAKTKKAAKKKAVRK